ncbi:tetratricopeptide repeat protein [Pelagicoccus albus]|uniref:Tetratricopeptide repeat protein n=1 Tax=Pelagicoccus albus TaxID=415222 RepID=A0A7X1B941_9BACT|nr:tetratricopeptide repeat protein [Pelagicoccus albus]MBC2607962.1 tetratricopeptide repeat protein [Pelagicoccus albus]
MTRTHLHRSFRRLTAIVPGTIALLGISTSNAQTFPLSENAWDNPEFQERFLGSYGFMTETEPTISKEEGELFQTLAPTIRSNPQQAIETLKSAITPESSAALTYTLGNLYLQTQKADLAEQAYRDAIKKFPNFARAYMNMGLVLVQDQRFEDATPFLTKAVELGTGTDTVYGLLGLAYLNQKFYDSAIDAYRTALILNPESKDWKRGKLSALIASGENLAAQRLLNELLVEEPDNSDYWKFKANNYLTLQDTEKAAASLTVATMLGADEFSVQNLLGDLYMNEGLPALALSAYQTAIKGEGVVAERALRMLKILTDQANFEQAEVLASDIENALSLGETDPSYLELLNYKAKIALGLEQEDAAAEILENIVSVDPLNGRALILLGEYFWKKDDLENALVQFERAEKAKDFTIEAMLNRARVYVQMKDYRVAADILRSVQAIDPKPYIANYLTQVEAAIR